MDPYAQVNREVDERIRGYNAFLGARRQGKAVPPPKASVVFMRGWNLAERLYGQSKP